MTSWRSSVTAAIGAIIVCASAAAPTAQGASLAGEAASCLAANPVCVERGASPTLTPAQAGALRRRIESEGAGPLYVAVVPARALDEAGGSANALLGQIADDLGRQGTYTVVAGRHLRAASTGSEGFSGADLATAAVDAHRSQGLYAILTDLVDRVASARRGVSGGASGSGQSTGGSGSATIIVIVVLVGLVAVVALLRRRGRRRRETQQLEEVKQAAREDLLALGEDLGGMGGWGGGWGDGDYGNYGGADAGDSGIGGGDFGGGDLGGGDFGGGDFGGGDFGGGGDGGGDF
jgi:hypothetical protein